MWVGMSTSQCTGLRGNVWIMPGSRPKWTLIRIIGGNITVKRGHFRVRSITSLHFYRVQLMFSRINKSPISPMFLSWKSKQISYWSNQTSLFSVLSTWKKKLHNISWIWKTLAKLRIIFFMKTWAEPHHYLLKLFWGWKHPPPSP